MTTNPDQPASKPASAARPGAMTADQLAAAHEGDQLSVVTGVHLMQGLGHRPAQGFWAEAWEQVVRRPGAVAGLAWVAIIAFFACFSPLIASGHPLIVRELTESGMSAGPVTSPLIEHLSSMDVLLILGGVLGPIYLLCPWGGPRSERLIQMLALGIQGGLAVVFKEVIVAQASSRDAEDWLRWMETSGWLIPAGVAVAALFGVGVRLIPRFGQAGPKVFFGVTALGAVAGAGYAGWSELGAAMHAGGVVAWLGLALMTIGGAIVGVGAAWVVGGALITPLLGRSHAIAWAVAIALGAAIALVMAWTWRPPLEQHDYRVREARGEISAVYTLLPFGPQEGNTDRNLKPPGSGLFRPIIDEFVRSAARENDLTGFLNDPRREASRTPGLPLMRDVPLTQPMLDELADLVEGAEITVNPDELNAEILAAYESGSLASVEDAVRFLRAQPSPRFALGTDSLGQGVLSQMLHACRLSISIGLVSTGIAVVIGVTMGALMGYFGGWVDMLLYRVVEVFMAIPVLFLLIVAAAVLPRNTYVMMAIIGCVTWTYPARYIRAEFYKLRGQDFVQSARAVGLPLRSVLFKHMLPNGVTPVLVDASFQIAAAILVEAVLSFLALGPANQASWGRLLSDATNQVGDFIWWLAIFPGFAIFLTVLAYNLIGEALRDAIDPKLKKARV